MKTTRKILMLTAAILVSTTALFAQEASQKEKKQAQKEKIKAMKIAHITQKLELTTEESQKFWPVYNKYEAKMKDLHKERRKSHTPGEAITEDRANELIKQDIELRSKELDLHKAYLAELKTVIPSVKIIKLHKAERDFKRVLLKKMKGAKGPRNGPPLHGGPMEH